MRRIAKIKNYFYEIKLIQSSVAQFFQTEVLQTNMLGTWILDHETNSYEFSTDKKILSNYRENISREDVTRS